MTRPRQLGGRIVAAAWVVALAATVGLGVLGGDPSPAPTRPDPVPPGQATPDGEAIAASPAGHASETSRPSRPDREGAKSAPAGHASETSRPSRPAIGEDGLMGGLPFGTAWRWLRAEPRPD